MIEQARRFVLDNLPGTFLELRVKAEPHGLGWRLVDRALQNLRKRGFITFDRKGRDCVWRKVETTDAK